jgi:hypothetical protein
MRILGTLKYISISARKLPQGILVVKKIKGHVKNNIKNIGNVQKVRHCVSKDGFLPDGCNYSGRHLPGSICGRGHRALLKRAKRIVSKEISETTKLSPFCYQYPCQRENL